MKAAYFETTGSPEVFIIGELPDPAPGHGEVLIATELTSLNHADTIVRSGIRPYFKITPPHVLGSELVGIVLATGSGVGGFEPGERVVARAKSGSYAALALADANFVFKVPDNVTAEMAVGMGVSAPTAYRILMRRAELAAGQDVLITAAASGVGVLLVQLAKAAGARVIATAGGDAKRERLAELGADVTIDHYRDDVEARIAEATDGRGVHAVADAVSDQKLFNAGFNNLREGGKYVTYGNIASSELTFNVTALFGKGIEIRGLHGVREIEASEHAEDVEAVLQLASAGKLTTIVDQIRPLEEVAESHRIMEAGQLFGKLALKP